MHKSPFRRRRATVTLAAAALTSAVVAVPAAEASPTATEVAFAEMVAQRPLVEAAEALKAGIERAQLPGFAGITLEDEQVALAWKGDVPTTLAPVIAEASRKAAVRVAPAAYSLAELQAAADKLRSAVPVGRSQLVQAVYTPADGSGLIVSLKNTVIGTATTATTAVEELSEVPVKVLEEAPITEASRWDDSPPWKGGARIWNQTEGSVCTSGFAVRNAANQRFILTAEHCGNSGSRFADGVGEYIGTVGSVNATHDIELIPTANVASQIYLGGRNSNTVTPVTGWGHVFVGQMLCQGGFTSADVTGGPVCNLRVTRWDTSERGFAVADQINGLTPARGGDSGGPVYSASSGGVVANGITSWVSGTTTVGFQDFATANGDFGVYIP